MALTLEWSEIAIRLALTVAAGALLGINRSERGRAAGLRTNILVCVAASVSMIQANLLLDTSGKTPASFSVLDLMRLPLGILTGMGFIGAGAILRKGDMVLGVTTAATLWLNTIIGLCFGGGQIGLGLAVLGIGFVTLWGLNRFELHMHQDRRATLSLCTTRDGPRAEEIRERLLAAGYWIASWSVAFTETRDAPRHNLYCEIGWRGRKFEIHQPSLVGELAQRPGVLKLRWTIKSGS